MPAFPLDPAAIASEIEIPLTEWPGNCHGVAEAILRKMPIEGMRLVRGHYHGYVAPDAVYRGGVQQHSWLELADGRILDPTRWAMESPSRPGIYLGANDHYDEAGIELREAAQRSGMGAFLTAHLARAERDQKLADRLAKLAEDDLMEIFGLLDLPGPAGTPTPRDAAAFHSRLHDPYEHFFAPVPLFEALQRTGLVALAPADTWMRALKPEMTHVRPGTNRLYEAPPAELGRGIDRLFKVLCHFLCIERRDGLENELDQLGYDLEDLHEALNDIERALKHGDGDWLPGDAVATVAIIAGDLLGSGFGQVLRVERYARSVGLTRDELHCELDAFGDRSGYDLAWLIGKEAERAAEARQVGEPSSEANFAP